MKLNHSFTVPAPIDQAWNALLDVEQVASCIPGATLTAHDADAFTATVKVKIGAIQLTYGGQGKFVEQDAAAHRVIIEASGKERRGGGHAAATVTCRLSDQDGTTLASVDTDLTITGKPAQFGRGAIEDISAKIIEQFATNLAARLVPTPTAAPDELSDGSPPAAQAAQAPAAAEAIDLLAMSSPALRRTAGIALGAVVLIAVVAVLLWLLR